MSDLADGQYKQIIREELAELDLEANIDPLWDNLRPESATGAVCALRVSNALIRQELRKLWARFNKKQSPELSAEDFNALVNALRFHWQQLQAALADQAKGDNPVVSQIQATAPIEYPGGRTIDANSRGLRGDPYQWSPFHRGWFG